MSAKEAEEMLFCASCGVAGSDDIKLRRCTACHLAKYCSVKSQKDHRPQHKRDCKKRAAELRDEIYSSSLKAVILETARFVFCRCRLIHNNLL